MVQLNRLKKHLDNQYRRSSGSLLTWVRILDTIRWCSNISWTWCSILAYNKRTIIKYLAEWEGVLMIISRSQTSRHCLIVVL